MEHLGTLRQIAEFFSLRALWCMEIMTVFWHKKSKICHNCLQRTFSIKNYSWRHMG